jgi:outer membrane lipoprotein-sorting protein
MRNTAGALAFAGACVIACGQPKPDAAEIVRKVAQTYAVTTQYHFVLESHLKVFNLAGDPIDDVSMECTIAMRGPDHARIEGAFGDMVPMQLIVTGDEYSLYLPKSNQFFRHKASPIRPAVGDREITDDNLAAYLMQLGQKILVGYEQLATAGDRTALLREEHVAVAGDSIDCFVVELKDYPWENSTSTIWVDKKRHIILRDELISLNRAKETVTDLFKFAKINEPLSDELFAFSPPAGAQEVHTIHDLKLQ